MEYERHTHNGKLRGWWLATAKHRVYLAERTSRELDRESKTWMIEKRIILEAIQIGAFVGVMVRRGRLGRDFYLTRATDFMESPYAVEKWGDMTMRGLPPGRFLVSPERSYKAIERSVRLRR